MNWYLVKLKLGSPFATPWQADTIFGHLCWGLRYLHGVKALRDFLEGYASGNPPLLISNGFPAGFLPHPMVGTRQTSFAESLSEQKKHYEQNKKLKSLRFILREDFLNILKGGKPQIDENYPKVEIQNRTVLKNQLNRLSSTTGEEGNLFNFVEYFYPEIEIYLKCREDFINKAEELFNYLKNSGYGKRKSIGYGKIEDFSLDAYSGFQIQGTPGGFISLSNFIPSEKDPVRGSYQILVKYGRMGEEYASEDRVFKHPLLMLEAGAVFYDSPVREYYGSMIKNVNPGYPEAVHYALALPAPCLLPQN